jgi:hypothetical protein
LRVRVSWWSEVGSSRELPRVVPTCGQRLFYGGAEHG